MSKRNFNQYQRPHINRSDTITNRLETKHHIVPTSRWGSNAENNKIMLYENIHNSLHSLYWNATPKEQIIQRLKINERALWEFRKDIYDLLKEEDDRYYYKNGILVY